MAIKDSFLENLLIHKCDKKTNSGNTLNELSTPLGIFSISAKPPVLR